MIVIDNGRLDCRELLVDFYKSYTGPPIQRKPQQIIVYRDGVSESQFDQCLDLEVTAFLKVIAAKFCFILILR
jgi:eukaryotic translation initiation factor 2C